MLIAWGIVNIFFSKLILSQARWLLPAILATHQVAAGRLEAQGLFGLQRKLKTSLDNLERSCFKSEKLDKGGICNPIAKCWLSACKALGSIPEKKKIIILNTNRVDFCPLHSLPNPCQIQPVLSVCCESFQTLFSAFAHPQKLKL